MKIWAKRRPALQLLLLAVFVLFVAEGCSKKVKSADQGIGVKSAQTDSGKSIPAPEDRVQEIDSRTALLKLDDIFFDFDQASIRHDARTILDENVRWLKQNTNRKIVIEGHADERGTTEYNLALGERRAQAVKRYLTSMGVPSDRIKTISYGEEKPFCMEPNERCWQQNRRGHFVLAD